jgi:hypothetical protein
VLNILPPESLAAEAIARPALDGIFASFDTRPLVAIGDQHDLAHLLTFYAALIRDPRFAATVGNVVVEFGGSQHQDILDRYVGGADVAYGELAKVWRNTVAWSPSVTGIGYQTFFAQVRAANQSRPREQQIRVWLSEPPIDWGAIDSSEAWQRIYDNRDRHAADFIATNILGAKKKALVIYGTGHFLSYPRPSTWPVPEGGTANLREILDRSHPGALYVISTYVGYAKPGCAAALESEMNWPKRTLIAPIKGTAVEKALTRPECMPESIPGLEPLPPAEEVARLLRRLYEIDSGAAGDALLYLAPAADLMRAPSDPALWMDTEFFNEIARRAKFRGGTAVPFVDLLPGFAAPPQPWWRRAN